MTGHSGDNDALNPYRTPQTPGIDFCPYGLECPYCSHRFSLTLFRYIREPTDSHRCPACRQTAVLADSNGTWKRTLGMGVFHGLIGFPIIAGTYFFLSEWVAIGVGVPYLFVLFEVDRRYDVKRGLVKP